ncbi:type I secretion C-terminal target domain-containing protein [Kiloniella sp. b19]|uniref:type I secretion C-terminal target domain-containing protein n=1 Tax=Kiloniella sp. GXU_MW_B19 TaxID=3141326 RepID=UPI0031D2286D
MQDITKPSEPIVTAVDPTQQISPENQTALPGAEELQEVFEAATEGLSEEEISAFLFGDDADVLETAADSSPASGGGSAYRDDMGGLIELLDDRTAVSETAFDGQTAEREAALQPERAPDSVSFTEAAAAVATTATEPVSVPNPNLIVNGSFEANSLSGNRWGTFSEIEGWTSGDGSRFELQHGRVAGSAYDGDTKVELDGHGRDSNATIQQAVDGTESGISYTLSFWYTPRKGDGQADSSSFEVKWNGQTVLLVDSTGLVDEWQEFKVTVEGTSEADVLSFHGAGQENGYGALIDNVSLFRADVAPEIETEYVTRTGSAGNDLLYDRGDYYKYQDAIDNGENEILYGQEGRDRLYGLGGDDILAGGEGNDYLYGGAGSDILIGGEGSDYLNGNLFDLGEDEADYFVLDLDASGAADRIVGFDQSSGDKLNIHEVLVDLAEGDPELSVGDLLSNIQDHVEIRETGGNSEIVANGQTVAVVQNVTGLGLDDLQTESILDSAALDTNLI